MIIAKKVSKILSLFVLPFFSLFFIVGEENEDVVWESYCGGAGDDAIHSIIQNSTGEIIVAGQFYSNDFGKDGFVKILENDTSRTIAINTTTRRLGDDGINKIIQASDGDYWGVGFLEADGAGQSGWIFKSKEIESLKLIFEDSDTARTGNNLLDLVEDHNGDIYAIGHHDNRLCLMKWDKEGTPLSGFPYQYPMPSIGTALTITSKNEVLLTGYQKGNKANDSLLVIKIDESGKERFREVWPNARGNSIQIDKSGKIVIAGVALQSDLRERALVLNLEEGGELSLFDLPNELGESGILAMTEPVEGTVLLAGYSSSYRPGAQRTQALCSIVAFNNSSVQVKESFFGNNKQNDRALDVLRTNEGDIYVAGKTFMGKKKRYQGFIAKISRRESDIESITFINPVPLKGKTVVETPKYSIQVEAVIRSKVAIEETDYWKWNIVRTNQTDDSKEILDIIKLEELNSSNANYKEYKISKDIILDKGLNSIRITHRNGTKTDSSEEQLLVDFRASKLFLLSIGIPYKNLKYTTKDAADIEEAFASQADKHYSAVETVLLNSEEKTTYKRIKTQVINYTRYYNNNQMGEQDVLIVFISSHGKLIDNNFYIIPSGLPILNDSIIQTNAINFKYDILSWLEGINCTKIFLIDACYSEGGILKNLGDIKNKDKVLVISSSQANQRSYEDESWKNGAFVTGILSALNNTEGKNIDRNDDSLLSDDEFFDYIKKEVRDMVKEVKGKKQVPVRIKSGGERFIIFRY